MPPHPTLFPQGGGERRHRLARSPRTEEISMDGVEAGEGATRSLYAIKVACRRVSRKATFFLKRCVPTAIKEREVAG